MFFLFCLWRYDALDGSRRRCCWLAAIFRQRFTRKQNRLVNNLAGRRHRPVILRTPRFKAPRTARTSGVALADLWRRIFRRWQVPPCRPRTSAATSPTPTAELPAVAAITAVVSTVISTLSTSAKISPAITGTARRVILGGIVMRRKILWRGRVRFRLAFFWLSLHLMR